MLSMVPGEVLRSKCPLGGFCRIRCRAAALGAMDASQDPGEVLDRIIEEAAASSVPPDERSFNIARRSRQDRLNRATARAGGQHLEDCQKVDRPIPY